MSHLPPGITGWRFLLGCHLAIK